MVYEPMAEQLYPGIAVILSILGGILILLSGLVILGVGIAGMPVVPGVAESLIVGLGTWGIVCGIIVIVAGYMVYKRPMSHTIYGIVVLIFSILSFSESGGYIIGGILGIIGGLWAIFWKPKMATQPTMTMAEKPPEKPETPPAT
jgi:hypothetical protein